MPDSQKPIEPTRSFWTQIESPCRRLPDFVLDVPSPTRRHHPSGSHNAGWPARCQRGHQPPRAARGVTAQVSAKPNRLQAVQFSTSTSPNPQCLSNLFLINAQRVPDRPETHPEPSHGIHLGAYSLVLKRILGEHHKLQFDPRHGSNWSQPCPPNFPLLRRRGKPAALSGSECSVQGQRLERAQCVVRDTRRGSGGVGAIQPIPHPGPLSPRRVPHTRDPLPLHSDAEEWSKDHAR